MQSPRSRTDARFADLAEIVLAVAREIRIREYASTPEIALTPSHASVMRYIDATPGATASEVADVTGLKRSNLSLILKSLEESDLIERRSDPVDGRGVRLFPTKAAAATRRKIRKEWSGLLSRALGSPAGVEDATAVLEKLARELVAERRREGVSAAGRNL